MRNKYRFIAIFLVVGSLALPLGLVGTVLLRKNDP